MTFSGIKKVSLIDYPQKISCTLFTDGCNLRCPFCHNPQLVQSVEKSQKKLQTFEDKKLIKFMQRRKKKLDGIVITGGEPMIHYKKMAPVLRKIHKMGFAVKIDTNGTYPSKLQKLIEDNLVDFVAMDFKATPSKYSLMNPKLDSIYSKVQKTLSILIESQIKYEIRTTVVPTLHTKEDIKEISAILEDVEKYVIQNFVPTQTLDPSYEKLESFTPKELEDFKLIASKKIDHVEIRNNV